MAMRQYATATGTMFALDHCETVSAEVATTTMQLDREAQWVDNA